MEKILLAMEKLANWISQYHIYNLKHINQRLWGIVIADGPDILNNSQCRLAVFVFIYVFVCYLNRSLCTDRQAQTKDRSLHKPSAMPSETRRLVLLKYVPNRRLISPLSSHKFHSSSFWWLHIKPNLSSIFEIKATVYSNKPNSHC